MQQVLEQRKVHAKIYAALAQSILLDSYSRVNVLEARENLQ